MVNKGGTSIVGIGDSDFAANKHFYNGNNSDLFLNALLLISSDNLDTQGVFLYAPSSIQGILIKTL
jgi:hypothetical protein